MDQSEYEHYQMQDAMQQSQMEGQRNMMLPQMFEQFQQNQAVLIQETDPKKVITEIMLTLRGLEKKEDGSLVRVAEPKLNKIGQENVWTWARGFVHQSLILSHFSANQIAKMMDGLGKDLVDDLTLNKHLYGINNNCDLDLINNLLLININAILQRALEQNEKNWIGKMSIENITNQPRLPSLKKEGFLSKLRL